MYFKASEVVPIYFCLFTIGGVMGAAMAYRELCWPWVLLFLPGLALCMLGVFAIATGPRVISAARTPQDAARRAVTLAVRGPRRRVHGLCSQLHPGLGPSREHSAQPQRGGRNCPHGQNTAEQEPEHDRTRPHGPAG